jgi:Domain of unknown function (DUF1127)
MKMNRYGAYLKFFTLPVIGTFSLMIGKSMRLVECSSMRDRSLQELPDHVLKDIGMSRSEILSLATFRGSDATRIFGRME